MPPSEPVRLQKFLADTGACSRRAAEALIAQGEVWVNGKRAVAGQKVVPSLDRVVVGGVPAQPRSQARMTVAVHKPRGLVCSNDDPHNPDTVFSLLPADCSHLRFFCAGRLDKDSEGLVILTTDGDLAQRLTHPSNEVVKRYRVALAAPFPSSRLALLVKGVSVEGEHLKVERAALAGPGPASSSRDVEVAMHHGKKREIRHLFKALGHDVSRLRRTQIGALRLDLIPPRGARRLSGEEVDLLFQAPAG